MAKDKAGGLEARERGKWLDKCKIYSGISWLATFAEQVQRELHLMPPLPQRDNYKLPVGLCELPVALGRQGAAT